MTIYCHFSHFKSPTVIFRHWNIRTCL